MDEIKKEEPKYEDVEVIIIDEGLHPEEAEKYDYYYVPTYYVGGVKVHEGVATKAIVHDMYKNAFEG